MTGSRASRWFAPLLASAVLVGLPTPTPAQGSGPIQLAPPRPLVTAPQPAPTETTPDLAPQQSPSPPGISVLNLGTVAGEAVGVLGPRQGGFGTSLWTGADRPMVERLVPKLPARSSSRTVRDLTRRLLLTAATPPAGEGQQNFVTLRAERLFAMGDVEGAAQLINNTPPRQRDENLLALAVQADLLRNDLASACAEVDENPSIFTVFWQKATVFCRILAGDESQAALGLALLREQGGTDDVLFFQLIDSLMAGSGPGEIVGGESGPLNLALLRVARAQIPASLIENADPGMLRAIALSPNAGDDTRLRAGIAAHRFGALEREPVREILRAHVDLGADDDIAEIAAIVLAASQETVPTARAAALQRGLMAAVDAGVYPIFARIASQSIAELAPSSDIAWVGPAAVRALLLNGRTDEALAWYEVVKAEGRFDPEFAAEAQALWPLLRLAHVVPSGPVADESFPPDSTAIGPEIEPLGEVNGPPNGDSVSAASVGRPGRLAVIEQLASRDSDADIPQVFPFDDRALHDWLDQKSAASAVTLAALSGFGDPIEMAIWTAVAGMDSDAAAPGVDPVLWLALQQAAADARLGETILLALVMIGDRNLQQVNPLALYGAVSALHTVGLVEEARRLAVEAALAAGA